MVTGLANLMNAIQTQAGAASPARKASFAKIVDFYGNTQDPIRQLQDFETACQANNITDVRK